MLQTSRIEDSIDTKLLAQSKIVMVGVGGAFSLALSLVRSGIGRLTVLDIDTVDDTNIVRQGYSQKDIGKLKVDALKNHALSINPQLDYTGISQNFLEMKTSRLDEIFANADILIFGTDSFKAQSFGNILALKYQKPAIWGGWYAKSRTAELFFQVPLLTPSCFRCCMSSRYEANQKEEIRISSNCNTIFHSQLLDSLIGFIVLAVLQRKSSTPKEFSWKFGNVFEHNFFQFKAHPDGGNALFERAFGELKNNAFTFQSYWQRIEPELKKFGYDYDCPDCQGKLYQLTKKKSTSF